MTQSKIQQNPKSVLDALEALAMATVPAADVPANRARTMADKLEAVLMAWPEEIGEKAQRTARYIAELRASADVKQGRNGTFQQLFDDQSEHIRVGIKREAVS